jgi:hypothetical protein
MRRTYQTPEKPTSAQFKFQIPHFKILNAKQDAPSAGARILMMGDGDGRNVLNVMVLRHKSLIILRGGLAGGLACLYTTPTPRGLFSYRRSSSWLLSRVCLNVFANTHKPTVAPLTYSLFVDASALNTSTAKLH